MKNRMLTVILCGILIMSMASACGSSAQSGGDSSGTTSQENTEETKNTDETSASEEGIRIPNPVTFFNAPEENVDVIEKEGSFSYASYTDYGTLDLMEEYMQLLVSDYNFTQREYSIYDGDAGDAEESILMETYALLTYDGDSGEGEIVLRYFHNIGYNDTLGIAITCDNYVMEDVESYIQDVDITLPDPDAVFGIEGDWQTTGRMKVQYLLDSDAQEAAETYMALLMSDYGFEMISKNYDYETSEAADYFMTAVLAPDGDCQQGEITIIAASVSDDTDYIYMYLSNLSADAMLEWSENVQAIPSGEDTLVAEELSSGAAAKPSLDAMDLLYYAQQEMSFGDVGPSGTSMVRDFSGTASDYDVLYAYAELLCEEYDFELVADPYYSEGSTYTFIEFVLNYTGSKSMTGSGIEGVYTDNSGDIMIYAQVKRDKLKGAIWYDSALEMSDDGYVYGNSSSGGSSYIGDSFTAGLYRLADGSFQTTDGRLTASAGEAMLISDGTSMSFTASYLYDNDDNRQEIYVKNSYGTEQQVIYIPTTVTLATGQIYDSSYFIKESDWSTNERGISSNVPAYTWTAMFACLHDGDYIYPVRGLSGVMTDLNVRVMYVDESVAVFYTCAQFESEPYEVEALIAVAIGADTVVENQPDGEYAIAVGEYVDITGPSEFDTGYNLWEWEFVSGDEYATLTGEVAQICRITGTSAGEVRVRVTYSYSVKEPDVLTGYERSVGHSTTREYVITIG